MKNKKLCCRIFPIILILLSTLLSLTIGYSCEGAHSFTFLTNKGDIFNFIATVLFIAIIPIGIFYILAEKKKYENRAKLLSLLGFLPAIGILLFALCG